MINIAITGAAGRMGRTLIEACVRRRWYAAECRHRQRGQNLSVHKSGAYTGEVSGPMNGINQSSLQDR